MEYCNKCLGKIGEGWMGIDRCEHGMSEEQRFDAYEEDRQRFSLMSRKLKKRDCEYRWCAYREMNCSNHLSWFNHLENFFANVKLFFSNHNNDHEW